jgi:hypothetical protein
MDLKAVECGSMGWIDLAQDRERWRALVNTVINYFIVPTYAQFVHFKNIKISY